MQNIAVIGLGLIGGSLAKVLKKKGYRVLGFTKKKSTLTFAKKHKIIDIGYTKLTLNNLKTVEIIFLCVPIPVIPDYIKQISKLVKHEIILTDVGSVKNNICNIAEKVLPENIVFIGGHSMAGNENKGIGFIDHKLFNKCAWILTPSSVSLEQKNALKKLKSIVKQIGSVPIILDSESHDTACGFISHLPLLLSVGLCELIKNIKDVRLKNLAMLLASSGFRDVTRIAGGNVDLNHDLLTLNNSKLQKISVQCLRELRCLLNVSKQKNQNFKKTLLSVSNWRKQMYDSNGKNKLLAKLK